MSNTSDQEVQAVLLLSSLPGIASGLVAGVWLPWFGAVGVGLFVFFASFVFWGLVTRAR